MRTIVVLLLMCIIVRTQGQGLTRNNAYLELGGASLFYSVNYERLVFKNENRNIAVRVGVMYVDLFDVRSRRMKGTPIGVSYMHRLKGNFLEFGLTTAAVQDKYDLVIPDRLKVGEVNDLVLIPSVRAGIRHQPRSKGIFWNALLQFSLTATGPAKEFADPEIAAFPFASLGCGYAF